MFKEKYPLKVGSAIIAPLAQKHYFSDVPDLPFATLKGMYQLGEYYGIPKTSVRATLFRLCREGAIEAFTDEAGVTRYKMDKMMALISDNAALFGKSEGFTLAIFNFKKEDARERYRVREILDSFGFRKLAQNVYLNIRVDSGNIMKEMAKWGLQDNIYLFDCDDIKDASMIRRIASLWELDKWNDRLEEFYEDLRSYFSFEGLEDDEIYKRYSYGYSVFFVYFQEKHPFVPQGFLVEGYALGKVLELIRSTVDDYRDNIIGYYRLINR